MFGLRLALLGFLIATTAGLGAGAGHPSSADAARDAGLPLFGVTLGTSPGPNAAGHAQGVGAGFASVHFDWTELEPTQRDPSDPNFLDPGAVARLDALLSDLTSRGIVPVAGVGGAPSWAASHRNGPLYGDKAGAYTAFLTKLVERYKGPPYNVNHWILWSEADAVSTSLPPEFQDRGAWADDPAGLADVMRASYAAIKQVDPDAIVIMGPLAHDWFYDPAPGTTWPPNGGSSPGFNWGGIFRYTFLDQVLDRMLSTGGLAFDVLGVNAYITFAPGWERDARRRGRSDVDVAAKISHIQARLARRGVDVPIYVGESGFWSAGTAAYVTDPQGNQIGRLPASQETQAEYVAKLYARARSVGAAAVAWYAIDEIDTTTEHGLVDANGNGKLAYQAYRWTASVLRTPARGMAPALIKPVLGNVESYAFAGTAGCSAEPCHTVIAWATGSVSPYARVVAASGLRAYNLTGNPVSPIGPDSSGRLLYELTDSPVFFQRVNYSVVVPLSLRIWSGG